MSQTLRFVVLLFCLSVFTLPGMAQSQWKVGAANTKGNIYYINKDLVQQPNGNILGWEKAYLPPNKFYPPGSYSVSRSEWNCRDKTNRRLEDFIYDPYGNFIEKPEIDTGWKSNPPESVGEIILNKVCAVFEKKNSGLNKKSSSPGSTSSFAQVTRKTDLMSETDPNSESIRKMAVGEKLALVSEERVGVWYRVLDPKTGTEGWINGYHFKIVKAVKTSVQKGPAMKRRN